MKKMKITIRKMLLTCIMISLLATTGTYHVLADETNVSEETESAFEIIEEAVPVDEDCGEEEFAVAASNEDEIVLINDTESDPENDNSVTGTIKKVSQDLRNGTFTISYQPFSPSGVTSVRFWVWTKDGKKDKYKYPAKKNEDVFSATISNKNHDYHSGTFYIRASVTLGNGNTVYTPAAEIRFKPKNQVYIIKTQTGRRRIGVVNPSIKENIRIKVWSEENGNDDVATYQAQKAGYKWYVDVKLYKHLDTGPFQIRVYSNRELLAMDSFTAQEGENLKRGWITEDGLKYYYKNGIKQKDVRNRVSGPYQVCVNRKRSTVTVYAKNRNGQYNIPVVSFICSAGENVRTPIGTFHFTSRNRWKYFKTWDAWVQYAVCFEEGRYFHSLLYTGKSVYDLDPVTYEELGTKASHGCIRLLAKDAKWIYNHMEEITEVRIYDSPVAGPFGKPKAPAIGETANGYYDPTDPAVK